jgi:hypothetical protein
LSLCLSSLCLLFSHFVLAVFLVLLVLVLLLVRPSIQGTNPSQANATIEVYRSLGCLGTPSCPMFTADQGCPPDMKGLLNCNNFSGDVVMISLRAVQLRGGSLSTFIGMLTALTELRVQFANLTGTVPTQIGLMRSLSVLALVGNQLQGTFPYFLLRLTGENSRCSTSRWSCSRALLTDSLVFTQDCRCCPFLRTCSAALCLHSARCRR